MPWQTEVDNSASRSFAADEQNRNEQRADPALGKQGCPECPARLVVVEFAEKPGTKTFFLGARPQYVNLSSADLVDHDPAIRSAHQLGQLPPIVVKVSPPQSKRVTLRLVRSENSHGFPGGSETLSGREQGLSHLTWPAAQSSVTTDGQGDGKLEPGIKVSALAGFKYHVEGSIDGGPFVRSSNFVNIRRRLAIRKVVRYTAGAGATTTAINSIQGDLDQLDIEIFQPPGVSGTGLGVREIGEINPSLPTLGTTALDSPAEVSVFRPHAVAIIVGEFIPTTSGTIAPQTFDVAVARGADGSFPASVTVPLSRAGRTYIVVPLTNGSQVLPGTVTPGGAAAQTLNPPEVTGADRFASSVSVNLGRFRSQPASVTTLTVSVTLKAISGWAVGWAYHAHPVIYLNLRDPNTDGILAAERVAALVIHELGHKLHLTSDGSGSLPDQQPHFYPSFNTNGVRHQGPHCSQGVPAGDDLWLRSSHNAATCTMWGALKQTRAFCSECQTTLRKVDLSSGF
ncbi:hypothetical protein [Piscinibacter sakaiensis]|uniref:hypothetical protein n=1 Tax=Piscinibacter sakaiensis TaxID=1547922 RepID=UPI003AB0C06C